MYDAHFGLQLLHGDVRPGLFLGQHDQYNPVKPAIVTSFGKLH